MAIVVIQDVGRLFLKILILRVTMSERIRKQIIVINTTDHRAKTNKIKIKHEQLIFKIKPTWCTIYSQYIYQSLNVLGDYGSIIRRNSCVFATLGTCYSVWMTVWYAGAYAPAYQT